MKKVLLQPSTKPVTVQARVHYSDNWHAWNVIRLPKGVLTLFPELKEHNKRVHYEIVCYKTHEEYVKAMKGQVSAKSVPLLLYLYQEDEAGQS